MQVIYKDELFFFNTALEAITHEEIELNKLFELNQKFYQKHHHGVCSLYETTFVYLIFKELLKNEFPYTVFWEYPYPNNSNLHSDLALLNENGDLEAIIEFKLWLKEDDLAIQKDIEKLRTFTECQRYIFVIGYGGDLEENAQYLTRYSGGIREIKKRTLKTKFFSSREKSMIMNNLNFFMYEVL